MENPENKPVTEQELIERSVEKRVTKEALDNNISKEEYLLLDDSCLTICVLTLQNGFQVTGESACANPANFSKDIGERLARESAVKKIWPLMGYVLKEEVYQNSLKGNGDTFIDRLKTEQAELLDKFNKLMAFINGNVQFKKISEHEQQLLLMQKNYMRDYLDILNQRLSIYN